MPTEIKMPQLGESVTEGTIGRWLKQVGEKVEKFEPLLEVVTDKVDTEVPAPVAGMLLEIIVPAGQTVRVGTVLARLGTETDAVAEHAEVLAVEQPTLPVASPPPAAATPQNSRPNPQHTFLSPVVARLVAEHKLDISQMTGTGAGGRISKQDVLRYLEQRPSEPAPPPAEAPAPAAVAPAAHSVAAPEPAPWPTALAAPLPDDAELVPLTPMRRSIAEHMARSVRIAPHVTTVMEVDLSRVMSHREQNQALFERQGVRLTFTPYFVQATAAGLHAFPVFNGRFTDDGIVMNRRMHIGVAVALDEGLLVPVIRDADEKNLLGLARAVNDLAERARSRRLRPDETQGGTFTVTNHGTSGSLFATPIINQPQAGIIGVGAIVKRPVVLTQHGVDAIAIKPMCYLSLTFDHRITDGATADAFLATVKRALEAY